MQVQLSSGAAISQLCIQSAAAIFGKRREEIDSPGRGGCNCFGNVNRWDDGPAGGPRDQNYVFGPEGT